MEIKTRQAMNYDNFFERVPGRCGGRWTLRGRRLEPGMLHDEWENGINFLEVSKEYNISLVEAIACVYFCQEKPEVLQEWRNLGI